MVAVGVKNPDNSAPIKSVTDWSCGRRRLLAQRREVRCCPGLPQGLVVTLVRVPASNALPFAALPRASELSRRGTATEAE